MKVHHLLLVSFIAPTSIAQSNTYWVHSSCQNPKFNGGFDFGIKDALFMARRSLMRLNAPVSPYMDDVFLLLFRKPRTDIATLNKVKNIFETIGERFVPTTNQVAAEVRFYCDNDEYGDGKRWTLTPNDPDDPIYVRNDQLPRLPPPGKRVEDQPLQQWQDETNWIRQSRGSMGCADPGTQAETYTSKFSSERSPSGMNANRATITICDSSLLLSELVTPEFLKYSSFKGLDGDFASRLPFAEFTTYGKQVVSLDILHELTHIDKDGFRTDDVTYEWEEIVTQSAEKAIRNAETFVLYAMFSRAADKGYRLRMDGADDAAKLQMINRAEIFYDQHLERVGGEQDTPF